ncbi:MAG: hypothetical protein RQ885_08125 [Desulfurococcales archaeon]|jgi:benzoyl-CoA reductase/2-hydroxyglutaryl-CoA dehydratase subunit BcrC/BadD/HgdB|nr:hypothetical protein [Desulfurococcales archaeon]
MIPRSIPTERHPESLRALKEEIEERPSDNWRTVRLRLLPSGSEHESLMGVSLACAKLFNEPNYGKRQAFFKGELRRTMRLIKVLQV